MKMTVSGPWTMAAVTDAGTGGRNVDVAQDERGGHASVNLNSK